MSTPGSNPVAWFDIGTPDVEAAKAFYGQLFGWSFAPDGAYTLITAPGAASPSGGIFNTWQHPALRRFVVQVADVAATAARSEELGAMVVAYLTDPNDSMFALFPPGHKTETIAARAATDVTLLPGPRPRHRGLRPPVAPR